MGKVDEDLSRTPFDRFKTPGNTRRALDPLDDMRLGDPTSIGQSDGA